MTIDKVLEFLAWLASSSNRVPATINAPYATLADPLNFSEERAGGFSYQFSYSTCAPRGGGNTPLLPSKCAPGLYGVQQRGFCGPPVLQSTLAEAPDPKGPCYAPLKSEWASTLCFRTRYLCHSVSQSICVTLGTPFPCRDTGTRMRRKEKVTEE